MTPTDAKGFFEGAGRQNAFRVYYQLLQAKGPETRQRRIEAYVGMFARGERLA